MAANKAESSKVKTGSSKSHHKHGSNESSIFWDDGTLPSTSKVAAKVTKRRTGYGDRNKYKWESNLDFLFVTVGGILSVGAFDKQVSTKNFKNKNCFK